MPRTKIRLYRKNDGSIPLQTWLDELEVSNPRAYAKCLQRIVALSVLGNELQRPLADSLRDGIHELRARIGRVNYRILYFFHGSHAVCLSHGLTKESKVPDAEIELAVKRKKQVESDSQKHTAQWEE
jgi:phage-related protein